MYDFKFKEMEFEMNEADFAERLKVTGRNDVCPCGSGKKYKKCHLAKDEIAQHEEFKKRQEEAAVNEGSEKESVKKGNKASVSHVNKSVPRINKVKDQRPMNIPRRAGI